VSARNVYLNDEDIRYLDNLNTPVKDGDELAIIPAVAGANMAETPDARRGRCLPTDPPELGVQPWLLATLHASSSSTAPTKASSIPTPRRKP
jgi:hypothetical protein